jgi:hypothetical protein
MIGCAHRGRSFSWEHIMFVFHCTYLSLFTFCSDVTLSGRFVFSCNEWLYFKTVITYTELQSVNFDSVEISL